MGTLANYRSIALPLALDRMRRAQTPNRTPSSEQSRVQRPQAQLYRVRAARRSRRARATPAGDSHQSSHMRHPTTACSCTPAFGPTPRRRTSPAVESVTPPHARSLCSPATHPTNTGCRMTLDNRELRVYPIAIRVVLIVLDRPIFAAIAPPWHLVCPRAPHLATGARISCTSQ